MVGLSHHQLMYTWVTLQFLGVMNSDVVNISEQVFV